MPRQPALPGYEWVGSQSAFRGWREDAQPDTIGDIYLTLNVSTRYPPIDLDLDLIDSPIPLLLGATALHLIGTTDGMPQLTLPFSVDNYTLEELDLPHTTYWINYLVGTASNNPFHSTLSSYFFIKLRISWRRGAFYNEIIAHVFYSRTQGCGLVLWL